MNIVNKRNHKPTPEDLYIGRPSELGNPFIMHGEDQRQQVITAYEAHIRTQPKLMGIIKSLSANTNLVCWCAPKPCHGDVIKRIWQEGQSDG